jgi:hypothetical protein
VRLFSSVCRTSQGLRPVLKALSFFDHKPVIYIDLKRLVNIKDGACILLRSSACSERVKLSGANSVSSMRVDEQHENT